MEGIQSQVMKLGTSSVSNWEGLRRETRTVYWENKPVLSLSLYLLPYPGYNVLLTSDSPRLGQTPFVFPHYNIHIRIINFTNFYNYGLMSKSKYLKP